jgi:ubiquinone/menaquinone biosynthesis C-methylase UbiE
VSLWNVDDYVRLRTGGDDPQLDAFAERNALSGKRVLDLGCGPGRASAALANRHGAHVTAVDAAAEMLAAARAHVPPGVDVVEASAEALPFANASFDAVLASFVVHLIDRGAAFSEVRRVLADDGVFCIKTSDPSTFADYWTVTLFPSWVQIESARFPAAPVLRSELEAAGFESIHVERIHIDRQFSRKEGLDTLTSGALSTVRLLPPGELAEGISRAPEQLTDPVRYTLSLLLVEARA